MPENNSKPSGKLSFLVPIGNSLLFALAGGLVGYLLYLGFVRPEAIIAKGALNDTGQTLLLVTGGLLLSGLLYSLLVVHPVFRRQTVERTKLDKRTENLQIQASTDPLTGLHNRRYFEQAMENYLREFNKMGALLGILILDLDHFKSVNDNYGHDVGDMVLREVALRMRASTREHDIVARIGGEEFAIITPYASKDQLLGVAERFRKMIEALKITHGNIILRPTVSIGVATNENGENNPDDLYKAADKKLYLAKNSGRNRVAA